MSEELKEYQQQVEFLANTKNSINMANSSKEHAEIIMSNIFRTSEEYVYIFAGSLRGEVSSDMYLEAMTKLLMRKTSNIKVVLENKPDTENQSKVLKLLSDAKKSSYKKVITLKYLEVGIAKKIFEDEAVKHFTISDKRMFREEDDTQNYFATASFNDPNKVKKLEELFFKIDQAAVEFSAFPIPANISATS